MNIIPIIFTYEGATMKGQFRKMHGEDGSVWYSLYIGEFIYGQLFKSEKKGWIFKSNRGLFEEQQYVDLFVSTIQSWSN